MELLNPPSSQLSADSTKELLDTLEDIANNIQTDFEGQLEEVTLAKINMMELITVAAAQAIAKIAFDKFVEGGAGELGKNMTTAISEKVQKLGMVVWNRIKGNTRAVEVLEKAAQGQPEETQQLKNYLYSLWQDENSEFAREVKKLADEIHVEITNNDFGNMNQIVREQSTGYQTKTGPNNTNFFGGSHQHGK
ncbi:MAG TPA: hypothetical protein DCE56_05775 [Cyanobacteria bacterium UBA8553]|nr:hypothetical protein [Cyanobacteria bacterium UBA8553]HAJ63706.1 hypothetical protein [Cyanobacteria bacterium UBA8543]